jgi:hypothetical protein
MAVKRFSLDLAGQAIDEDPRGDFVDYADYERLEEENAELRQAINRLEENRE